jgi:hypothetical protein
MCASERNSYLGIVELLNRYSIDDVLFGLVEAVRDGHAVDDAGQSRRLAGDDPVAPVKLRQLAGAFYAAKNESDRRRAAAASL